MLQTIFEDSKAALTEGTLDKRGDRHLSWTPMILDAEGWEELTEEMKGMLERIFAIQAASAKRLTKADEPGIPVSVSMLAYETPASGEKRATPKMG
jgi:hypothetical protein